LATTGVDDARCRVFGLAQSGPHGRALVAEHSFCVQDDSVYFMLFPDAAPTVDAAPEKSCAENVFKAAWRPTRE
jgi:hypothetical protein